MTGMEIALLILGIVVFIASFVIPETMKEVDEDTVRLSEEKVKEIVDEQVKDAKNRIDDIVDEALSYGVEKSERSLERVTNEKITAVSEFSETVLSDINKNHQEVMFMYDMLHDKQKSLHETVVQADKTSAMAKEAKTELELAAKELTAKQETEVVRGESSPVLDVDYLIDQNTSIDEIAALISERKETVGEEPSFEEIDLVKETVKKPKKTTKAKTGKVIEPVAMPVIGAMANESNNNNDRILELHKQGKSNIAIAKELGLGVGEVNLVIDLFEVM